MLQLVVHRAILVLLLLLLLLLASFTVCLAPSAAALTPAVDTLSSAHSEEVTEQSQIPLPPLDASTPDPPATPPQEAPTPGETAPVTATDPTPTQPSPLEPDGDILISSFRSAPDGTLDFIELHNTTSAYIPLSALTLDIVSSSANAEQECVLSLDDYMKPGQYVGFLRSGAADQGYTLGTCPPVDGTPTTLELTLRKNKVAIERVTIVMANADATAQWVRRGWTASYRTGVLEHDFRVDTRPVYVGTLYTPPAEPTLQFQEVFPSPKLCGPNDTTPTCHSYVKLKNTGEAPVDLSLYRLRSGDQNARSSQYNTSTLLGLIAPGATVRIDHDAAGQPLSIDAKSGAVWLEDRAGLVTYHDAVSPYERADLVAHHNFSWAYDARDNTWKWAIPSPNSSENHFIIAGAGVSDNPTAKQYAPCRADQYRSPDTHRCRNAVVATSYTPCRTGQYRSPTTHRCRSSVTATATLTPCKPGQTRNPSTNRCRSSTVTTASLKPCAANQTRNPTTNRCRKVPTKTTAADFAVEPIQQGAKAFAGWWALGGLAVLAGGYATWEWREEIGRLITRVHLPGKSR